MDAPLGVDIPPPPLYSPLHLQNKKLHMGLFIWKLKTYNIAPKLFGILHNYTNQWSYQLDRFDFWFNKL